MNSWTNCNPKYNSIPIKQFQGNPLIEALEPPPFDNGQAIDRLSKKPDFVERERDIATPYRMLLPARLLNFMFPTNKHVSFFNRTYSSIQNGYLTRNPMIPEGQAFLHEAGEGSYISSIDPTERNPGVLMFLTGMSGMGKSALIRAIMRALGKPVIVHSAYNGSPICETQILFLMRNVPDQCSAKNLCMSFGYRTDELLGGNLYGEQFVQKMSRTDYVTFLREIIATNHIGVLIIDEFQNLSLAKSGGKEELLALLLNLREELGIPIIVVGTYKTDKILREDDSLKRRIVEGGFLDLERPKSADDEDWHNLCDIMWGYQWIKKPQPFSEEVSQTLYKSSAGNTGIMLNLFVTAQTLAIESGIETITPQLIERVYHERLSPLHGIVNLLQDENADLTQYEDLYFNADLTFLQDPLQSRIHAIKDEIRRKENELIGADQNGHNRNNKKVTKPIAKTLDELYDHVHGKNSAPGDFSEGKL